MHICRKEHAVVVQGITGKQGTFWTERMQDYGTNVIGGVKPKKAGTQHCRVPVSGSTTSSISAWMCLCHQVRDTSTRIA